MELIVSIKADSVIAKLQNMPARFRAELIPTINGLTLDMQRSVVLNKLEKVDGGVAQGGQVLRHISGTLARSISQDPATARNGGIFGGVFTTQDYGIMWEEGFTRKIGAGARGGPRTLRGNALAKYFERHPPGTRNYQRPYLKPTLEEFTPRIKEDIRTAALKAFRE